MSKYSLLGTAVCLVAMALPARAENASKACAASPCPAELVYFGTRAEGAEQGIYGARLDRDSGKLTALGVVADIPRPTWLLASPRASIVYAVSEVGNDGKSEAAVFALGADLSTGALQILNQVGSGGGGATHLALDPLSSTLFVANYGSGQVSSLPVNADGSLDALVSDDTHAGTGPSPRQSRAHAHGVTVDPSHHFLLSPDLGADRVFIYRINALKHSISAVEPPFVQLDAGSGPRHLVFDRKGRFALLLNELSANIVVYRWDAHRGHLSEIRQISVSAPDFTGKKDVGDIAVSRDGRFVYASSRGENSIVVYAFNNHSGMLTEVQRLDAQGQVPWAFAFDSSNRWMLVADQGSDSVVVFKVDTASGKLSDAQSSLAVPKPVNVTFVPASN